MMLTFLSCVLHPALQKSEILKNGRRRCLC
nr:MAG TPA: hypothetical protein [Caudoviricetes sp.]